jgi:hypothetical protein
MGAVRAMLLDAGLPQTLWVEAARHVQHLNNRSPVAGCTLTPHEALTGDKPDVSDLRVWGCTAYVMIPQAQQTKLGPHSRKGQFVGIQPHSKAYRVLVNGSIVISTQVRFDEDSPTPTPPRTPHCCCLPTRDGGSATARTAPAAPPTLAAASSPPTPSTHSPPLAAWRHSAPR